MRTYDIRTLGKKWSLQANFENGFIVTTFLGISVGPPGHACFYETLISPTKLSACIGVVPQIAGLMRSGCELEVIQYRTRAEALEGHKSAVKKWKAKPVL